ncbi:CapA family protein [Actinomycetospora chibensis]|uniref:CapA family protein n=1 Tax=Actinomycetospora chibensis TaxID=663606 RepID=A0ABV9RH58_9PSEU|nr:CapA family protein [Actinomycetospora chibensis]MDD7922870.1 CapA family protein [Actinomycetospora chibensis]
MLVRALVLLACAVLVGCAPSSAPSPAASARPSAGPPAPTSFTLVAGGDVLVHPTVTAQALADGGGVPDFAPQLAALAPIISGADLALCHLEVPLARPGGPYAGYPAFNAPPELARSLAAVGYDGCSTASNHALDQGTDGVARTLGALDAAGVRHAGTARTPAEAAATTLHDVHGVRVAHLSATFGVNDDARPGDPWSVAMLDPSPVLAAASRARAAGADVVVLSAHWGTENDPEPNAQQLRLAPELLASPDIDLLIGHHAHVVQPFERLGDEWVAYGLGNQLADQETPGTDDGALGRFTFTRSPDGRWRVARAEYVPTWIDVGPPIRVVDVTSAPPGSPAEAARARTDARVAPRGTVAAGLTRG